MPRITAILHTCNDARRLGRALESLRPCDEVLVIDHNSTDETPKIARQHGAIVKIGIPGMEEGAYLIDSGNDWILRLLPSEALSEALEASLFEWKDSDPGETMGFAVSGREETDSGWRRCPPEMRLFNRTRGHGSGALPPNPGAAPVLAGDLLRFRNKEET